MLKNCGILKGYDVRNEWALRANTVTAKQGMVQFVEADESAIDPNTALTRCTTGHKKCAAK